MDKLAVLSVLLVVAVSPCKANSQEDKHPKIDLIDIDPLELPLKSSEDVISGRIRLQLPQAESGQTVTLSADALNPELLSIEISTEPMKLNAPPPEYKELFAVELTLNVSKLRDGVTGDLKAILNCTSGPCIGLSDKITVYKVKEDQKIPVRLVNVSSVFNDTAANVTVTLTKDMTTAKPLPLRVTLKGDNDPPVEHEVTLVAETGSELTSHTVFKNVAVGIYHISVDCPPDKPFCISVKPCLILPSMEIYPGVFAWMSNQLTEYRKEINKLQNQLAGYDAVQDELSALEGLTCGERTRGQFNSNSLQCDCNDGYSGPTCSENQDSGLPTTGTGSGSQKAIVCMPHGDFKNGMISYAPDKDGPEYDLGTVATYVCDDGFALVGDETRTCEQEGTSGIFRGMEPTCEPIVCTELNNTENGMISYTPDSEGPEYDLSTVATYVCDDGFMLVGNETRTCVKDATSGKFNGTAPTCELETTSTKPASTTAPSKTPPSTASTASPMSEKPSSAKPSVADTSTETSSGGHYMELAVGGLIAVLVLGLLGYVLFHYRAQVKEWACAKKAAVSGLPRSIPQRLRRGGRYTKLPRTMQEALHQD